MYVFCLLALGVGVLFGGWFARHTHQQFFKKNKQLQNEVLLLQQILETTTRQKDEYFRAIDGVVAECNQWRKLYYTESLMHSNAQQLLLRELQRLSRGYQTATGRKAPLSESVVRVLAEYSDAHPTLDAPKRVEVPVKPIAPPPTT